MRMDLKLIQSVYVLAFISLSHEKDSSICYIQSSYRTCRRWFGWGWGCKTKYSSKQICCKGYSGRDCLPLCGFGQGCNKNNYGKVIYKDEDEVITNSGGTCDKPSTCVNCNEGYYSTSESGGYCKACYKPENCNRATCTNNNDYKCEYCVGEYKRNDVGFNIYTSVPNNKLCQRTCSWEKGARCFPGTCSKTKDMLLADCECAEGFQPSFSDCATATRKKMPLINKMIFKLHGYENEVKLVDKSLKGTMFWTRHTGWTTISLESTSHYKPSINNTENPDYIKDYSIGIERLQLSLTLSRGSNSGVWRVNGKCTGYKKYMENCYKTINDQRINGIKSWNNILNNGPFMHADRINFAVSTKNGGIVWYQNRSSFTEDYRKDYYFLKGITTHESLELGIDEYEPTHCFETNNYCPDDALEVTDFLNKPKVTAYWGGWTDADSGIETYEFNIYYLRESGDNITLTEKYMLKSLFLPSSEAFATLEFPEAGPYSIELIVHDRAENYKVARRIVLFDNASVVDLYGERASVVQANKNGWINMFDDKIEIIWPNRFRNIRHSNGGWLKAVRSANISRDLDDRQGISSRTVESFYNIEGIVRFDVASVVELHGMSTTKKFERIPDNLFKLEKMKYSEDYVDGKKLTYFIRGTDAVGEFAEDNVTAMIDLSPPIIQNLWLTKDDWINISVHSVHELTDLIIEWETFDFHSGIHEVSWKIFDNFTRTTVVHGRSNEPPQGETQTLTECNQKYGQYSRGPNCYCSPHNGCFHKHFQIKPQLTAGLNNGLSFGKEVGIHDYDYFIEVTVINNAGLASVERKKISIDVSPPHEGNVHDGLPEFPEVDFQQHLHIRGNWNGFLDKESGVKLYTYGFSKTCLSENDLNIHSKTNWTYGNTAEFIADKPGTYFLTVMAYNHALDHSKPVCSDGVTIDDTPAVISEVVVKNAVTQSGLIKSDASDSIFHLNRNRELVKVETLSKKCSNRATIVPDSDILLYPHKVHPNGTRNTIKLESSCNNLRGLPNSIISFIRSDYKIDISWNVSVGASDLYDFEVGISSEKSNYPDIFDYKSANHHQYIRLINPNIFSGELFYLMIKSITKSSVIDVKVIGPFAFDSMKPEFRGDIKLSVERNENDTFLIANWGVNAFTDHGYPHILSYEAAIGTSRNGQDVVPFRELSYGGSCVLSYSPTCTAFSTQSLHWNLHAYQDYFVTIKATDTTGNFIKTSSNRYRHKSQLASGGVVQDIDNIVTTEKFVDIEDIDFQASVSQLSSKWSGFHHLNEHIIFAVCIATDPSDTFIKCERAEFSNRHTFTGLNLTAYKTYYQTVIAETEVGNVTAVSDGVAIVINGDTITGTKVFDGLPCNNSLNKDLRLGTSHHAEETRIHCKADHDYQASTNELKFHWTIPTQKAHFLRDIYWSLEERSPVADTWKGNTQYQHLPSTASYVHISGLSLSTGRKYRVSLKFCAKTFCFQPVKSDGITIISNLPITGDLTLKHGSDSKQMHVSFERFFDADIVHESESLDVIDHYEWTITDDTASGRLHLKWSRVPDFATKTDNVINFTIQLNRTISFSKCKILTVRGYTKTGLANTISKEIKDCKNIQDIRPSLVIDAVGDHLTKESNHIGNEIMLQKNAKWEIFDKDYTPHKNILSAVWPILRYPRYNWAVLHVNEINPNILNRNTTDITELREPCSHPEAIKCGSTEHEYINVGFDDEPLTHGNRYMICIHANKSILHNEFWEQHLEEISTCSDGITVDLTQPVPANVWIGQKTDHLFQTSSSDISVNWNSFTDVEEEGYAAHVSGITHYEVTLGTSPGGVDVKHYTDVGLTNHHSFHNLKLHNGHTYFATVKAFDFTGQFSSSVSEGIKIDTTPPHTTQSSIKIPSRHITNTRFVEACWTSVFVDVESGISHYSWAVGTHSGYDDIFSFFDTREECAVTSTSQPLSLKEGHAYFITVKAYNKAGLSVSLSSWAFVVDETPPITGSVFDGPSLPDGSCLDVDYVSNITIFRAHWKGFIDPHSTLVEYLVQIGSCRNCEDVLTMQSVGLRSGKLCCGNINILDNIRLVITTGPSCQTLNDIELTSLLLSEGSQYYVTVTACNTANLCSSASSDGFVVDSTPPIKGVVNDGIIDTDIQYQGSKNFVGCKWFGFTDPQSDISHYVWRVGTAKGGDDIVLATEVLRHEEAFIFDLHAEYGFYLPKEGHRIYCTVRAYNRAGQFIEASSNGFLVDDTSPIFTKNLSMSSIGMINAGTTILRSTFKVFWDLKDEESFIEKQHISISSHIGGDFNLSSTMVEGIVRDYIFTGLDFHDGSYYSIKLLSCNGAQLCTESVLKDILVDSSPPTTGTFAITTDHAASLSREPPEWMKWTPIYIKLAWLGFDDIHSGIDMYMINIGSRYMDNDLNEEPGKPMIVKHDSNTSIYEEGKVQKFQLRTQRLKKNMEVFISIVANNNVGLTSEIAHSQFNLLFGGIMELVRRCDSHSCEGHCVCAPFEKKCYSDNICNDISGPGNKRTLIDVEDAIELQFPDNIIYPLYSPINTMLGARWKIKIDRGQNPMWYEWSVGESIYDYPLGVFHTSKEKVWHDNGKSNSCVFVLERGRNVLEEHTTYSVFVRAWYDSNTFAIFKSKGVTIFHSPPLSISQFGKNVNEVLKGTSRDVDFITRHSEVYADWTGKFTGGVSRYHLYLSSFPGGHDLCTVSQELEYTITRVNISGLHFEENTKYYTIVQAFNPSGLHTIAVSDGFMIDNEPPTSGIVMDGHVLIDENAISNSSIVQSFWYGFSDFGSGIKTYEYCVSSENNENACDIVPMAPVGVATNTKVVLNVKPSQGMKLKGVVRARDVMGHTSHLVSSNGVIIDSTPPVRYKNVVHHPNVLLDTSFENMFDVVRNDTFCGNISNATNWSVPSDTCVSFVKSATSNQVKRILHVKGSLSQNVQTDHPGKYKLILHTSIIPSSGLYLSTLEGYVQVNDQKYIFLMYNKPNTHSYNWQKHIFFFNIQTNTSTFEVGTALRNIAFAIDDVQLQLCEIETEETNEAVGHVNIQTVFVHDWSSIHADWTFADPETDILEYIWAIGTVQGGTQLQSFVSVGRRSFANNNKLRLEHNTVVHITVVAINAAGLRTVSYSDPILIDLTTPECHYVHEGSVLGQDQDYIRGLNLDFHWNISDQESGLMKCEWALGTFKGDDSLHNFTAVEPKNTFASKQFQDFSHGKMYVTIRCSNAADLTSTCYSNGVKLVHSPPSIDDVILELMTSSQTQYASLGRYHGNSSDINFRWTGFDFGDGVSSYLISLDGSGISISEIVHASDTGYSYARFTGLHLTDGKYTVSVTGINEVKMYSQKISDTFLLVTEPPKLTGLAIKIALIKQGSIVKASWENVFTSNIPLYYEVSARLEESREGDLVQWQETVNTHIELALDSKSISTAGGTVRFTVRAISHVGLYISKHGNTFVLP